VATVLATIGMKQENIQLRGLGSSQPVASNDTAPAARKPPRVHRGERRLIGEQHLPGLPHQQRLIRSVTSRM
jgi:hypothetical protein